MLIVFALLSIIGTFCSAAFLFSSQAKLGVISLCVAAFFFTCLFTEHFIDETRFESLQIHCQGNID